MNFDLTEEQKMIKKMTRDFAEEVIRPRAIEIDKTAKMDLDIFKQMGELGLFGIPFEEKYGGSEGGTLSYILAVEEIGRVCGGTGLSYAANVSLGASPIAQFGTEEQKEKFLVPIIEGKSFGSFGLTEPNAGSDAGGTRTTAKEVDGKFIINGEKNWITNAQYASVITTTAVTGKRADGKNIISAVLVPTEGTKGLTITSPYDKMGVRGSNTCEIVYEDVEVPVENLLGDSQAGFKQFLKTLDGGRISIGALAVGIAQGALEKAINYSKERKQFGTSISNFQAIQFKLADMAMEVELARTMVHKAAWLKDNGRPFTKEAAMAKLYASETAFRTANQAIQIHGGYGYMREYEVERYLRDAKLLEIGEGTSEIQRMVISRQVLK